MDNSQIIKFNSRYIHPCFNYKIISNTLELKNKYISFTNGCKYIILNCFN